jgi:hypothetical protein
MRLSRGAANLVAMPPAYHWLLEGAAIIAFCAAALLLLWL